MRPVLHPEHEPPLHPWAAELRDDRSRETLCNEDYDFGLTVIAVHVSGIIQWWDARGMIALYCAPLRRPAPHTAWTATAHLHGLSRSAERATAHHRTVLDALLELFRVGVPLALLERQANEERFRRAVSGALLRRLPIREAGLCGVRAADFLLHPDRIDALLAEECAWWIRRRADA